MSRRLLTLVAVAMSLLITWDAFVPRAGAQQQNPGIPSFGRPSNDQNLVAMKMFPDTNKLAADETFNVVFVFDIEKSWHMYWKNPGAGAAPIEITVTAPEGFVVNPVRFPRPELIKSDTGDIYGYDKQVVLFVPITAPHELAVEAVMLQYEVSFAVCDDLRCVLQRRSGNVTKTPVDDPAADKQFVKKHEARLPVELSENSDAEIEFDGTNLTITGSALGQETAMFFPNPTPGVSFENPEIAVRDGQFVLTATISTKPNNFLGTKPHAAGLIGLGEERDDPSLEFSIALKN